MLKNISQLEHAVGDKVYHFMCDSNSPLNEVKDALFQFLKYVGQVEDAVKAQQAQAVAEAPVVEEPKVEEPKVEELKAE